MAVRGAVQGPARPHEAPGWSMTTERHRLSSSDPPLAISSRPPSTSVLRCLSHWWRCVSPCPRRRAPRSPAGSPYSAHSMVYAYAMPLCAEGADLRRGEGDGREPHPAGHRDARGLQAAIAATGWTATGTGSTRWWRSRGATSCRCGDPHRRARVHVRLPRQRRGRVRRRRLRRPTGATPARSRSTRAAPSASSRSSTSPTRAPCSAAPPRTTRACSPPLPTGSRRAPRPAAVLLGGVSGTIAKDWLGRVFATPGVAAATKFDIANVHVRGGLGSLTRSMTLWHDFFTSYGRGSAPLWVTEHGYPADTAYQDDPRYRGGEAAQAAFLRDSLPTLVRAGAAQIFVSTRDSWPEEFGASEPVQQRGRGRASPTTPRTQRAGARPPRSCDHWPASGRRSRSPSASWRA